MKKLLLIGLLSLSSINAFAWNAIGHRIIAEIALDNLTECSKLAVQKLFTALPNSYPQNLNLVLASDWLDRDNTTCPYESTHCLPPPKSWHFIDRPYHIGAAISTKSPTAMKAPNVVWAISQELQVLQSSKTTDADRAVALLMLDHLLGDITQPLHNTNGYSQDFIKGDHGGNDYALQANIVCYNRRGSPYLHQIDNLHSYWDQGAGLFSCQSPRHAWGVFVEQFAHGLEQEYQHNPSFQQLIQQELNQEDPNAWSLQAYAYASEVYQVQGQPNATYITWAESLTKQQITLAGYRMAKLLNQAFLRNGTCH